MSIKNMDSASESDKKKSIKLNDVLKESQNSMLLIAQVSSALNKIVKIVRDESNHERESVMKAQLTYKKQLTDTIDAIPLDKALELLNDAKSIHERYISDAKIRKINYSTAASNIEVIIDPLLASIKRKIEAEIVLRPLRVQNPPNQHSINSTLVEKKDDAYVDPLKPANHQVKKEFEQIECHATKDQIEKFFHVLVREKNKRNNESFMKKEDVDLMIRMNFKIFNERPVQKYYDLNLGLDQKGMMAYFMFQFFDKYEINPNGNKMKYVHFLIRNFERFKNDKPENLNKNMCRSKKPTRDIILTDRDLKNQL